MRDRPLVLVLDEPTAALDAETEHALFERYAAAVRGAATRAGRITILVSHRFSTVRMADLIVVLDGARVVGERNARGADGATRAVRRALRDSGGGLPIDAVPRSDPHRDRQVDRSRHNGILPFGILASPFCLVMAFARFHPVVRQWFTTELGEPTPAQRRGWEAIAAGRHTLIAAPTGSGKTLAAFLTAIDDAARGRARGAAARRGPRPLRLAAQGAERRHPQEPRRAARAASSGWPRRPGCAAPRITAAVRTGDTTPAERAAMLRTPPHILVTTPESLYLLLTSERSRQMLRTVRTVIVDEIHAVIGTRRGAHLALIARAAAPRWPSSRCSASGCRRRRSRSRRWRASSPPATRPAARSSTKATGARWISASRCRGSPLDAVMSHEVWEEYYDRLAALIATHRTTLVFVNTRRLAERLARHLSERLGDDAVTAHHGSLSKEKRLDAETRLKAGQLQGARRHRVARARHRHRPRRSRLPDRIAAPHRHAAAARRPLRPHDRRARRRGGCSRCRATIWSSARRCCAPSAAASSTPSSPHDAPLDVLAQQIVAESRLPRLRARTSCSRWCARAWPYRDAGARRLRRRAAA